MRGAAHRFFAQLFEAVELPVRVAVQEGVALGGHSLTGVECGNQVWVVEDLGHGPVKYVSVPHMVKRLDLTGGTVAPVIHTSSSRQMTRDYQQVRNDFLLLIGA